MASKVRTVNDQIADAVKGQAKAKADAKAAKQPKAGKAAAAEPKVRKPGNLKTTGLPNSVREVRIAKGLTPAQLADKAGEGLTASFVRRIERGARQATTAQVAALAKALGTSQKALGITDAVEPKAAAAPKAPRTNGKAKGVEVPADLQVGETREVELP